jgi:hypothetical protein
VNSLAGATHLGTAGAATAVDGTWTVAQAATLSGTLSVGQATTSTGAVTLSSTLAVAQAATFSGDLLSGSTGSPQNVFATTTGTVSLGGGPVNIGAASSLTAVDGTLSVAQTTTLTGAATLSSTLAVAQDATFSGSLLSGTIGNAQRLFATTTGKVTLGGGAVDIGAASSTTAMVGALTVAEATTLSSSLTLASAPAVSLASAHLMAKTVEFVSTSHATDQLNLPDASVAGQIYVACNKEVKLLPWALLPAP